MDKVTVKSVRSDSIYKKIMEAPSEKKDDIFRYDFMKQFEEKWKKYPIPLKAKQPGGYDIIMASGMMGHLLPQKIDDSTMESINLLSEDAFWNNCQQAIETSLQYFVNQGIDLPRKEYLFTVMLADPDSPYSIMNDNYCGDGGIPGYIFGSLVPSEYTMSRLPVALAHETNHNVRFQFEKWSNNISLGEYMVCEGLAENFATSLYGEEQVGPWVSKTDPETLNDYIKPIISDALEVSGFDNISAYMYGDDMAKMQNYFPVGLPYCAGYACGYHLVKHYLKKTGKSIVEATLLPGQEILQEAADFWNKMT